MARTATKVNSIYSVHPGVVMTKKWIAELKHRFEITSLKDIDDEVKRRLKTAYERDE